MTVVVLQGASMGMDLFASVADVAVIAGTLVLVLLTVAFGAFVYKSLRGGIRWPDDVDDGERGTGDEVRRGRNDEDWKYY